MTRAAVDLFRRRTASSCIADILDVNLKNYITRCTQSVRVVFSRARIRFSNSARMNKSNFTNEKIVFEIVVLYNVDNWIQLLT